MLIFDFHLLILLVLLMANGRAGSQMHTALGVSIALTLVSIDDITVVLHVRIASAVQTPRVLLAMSPTPDVKTGT